MGWLSAIKILHFRNKQRRFSYPLMSKIRKEFDENRIENRCVFYTNFFIS